MKGDFNTSFISFDRSSRQKKGNTDIKRNNKGTLTLKDTLNQVNLIGIQRTYDLKAEYTFFSNTHGIFFKLEYMLAYKQVSVNIRTRSYQASFQPFYDTRNQLLS